MTREWWEDRDQFDLYASRAVIEEAEGGDEEAARLRLAALEGIDVLSIESDVYALSGHLISEGPLPKKAEIDALHIALASKHNMDYLLTWNCAHIANAAIRHEVEAICRAHGFEPSVLCTPEELMKVSV